MRFGHMPVEAKRVSNDVKRIEQGPFWRNPAGKPKYKRLHVCDITSSRKRMSVIVEDEDGKIKLICKGADSIVSNILSTEIRASPEFKFTQDQVDFMANEGLRTLFVAEKEIQNDSYFQEWLGKVKQARNMA